MQSDIVVVSMSEEEGLGSDPKSTILANHVDSHLRLAYALHC